MHGKPLGQIYKYRCMEAILSQELQQEDHPSDAGLHTEVQGWRAGRADTHEGDYKVRGSWHVILCWGSRMSCGRGPSNSQHELSQRLLPPCHTPFPQLPFLSLLSSPSASPLHGPLRVLSQVLHAFLTCRFCPTHRLSSTSVTTGKSKVTN